MNSGVEGDQNPGIDTIADAASPEKLLEGMLAGADGTAAPFGIVRNERRAAKSASLKLEHDLASRLKDRAAALGISVESLVCLVWSLVLARFCGQDNVTFGAALPPAKRVIPLRIDSATRAVETAARETYELLAQIRASLPVLQTLLPEDPGSAYFLPALFGYGLPEEHFWIEELYGGAWPLAVIAAEQEETLVISAWAQIPAEPETVCAYMRTALERLAGTLETAPDTLATSIDVMPEEERRKLLFEWNATGVAYPHDKCVHELFEEQAARTPDAVAVVHDGGTLTYSQLNARANQLAHHLRGLGVGPEALVAICLERSLEMVVGLLAVLKAGGAYVPMDSSYPQERLAYMLKDSAPAALLTQAHLRDMLPDSLPVIALDTDAPFWADRPDSNPDHAGLTQQHLAYVIYTSGSTGKPKGVMVEHRGLTNLAGAQIEAFAVGPGCRILQFASFSFDASIWEVVMALCSGASLYVAQNDAPLAGDILQQTIAKWRITHVTLPPAVLTALPKTADMSSVRSLTVAGEAPSMALARRWAGGRRFINAYGPTEATVCATVHVCDPHDAGTPPIGRPIANTQIYILDARGEPAPVGVPGEIYIGGAGVARGYLNRPDLTAERFVVDPFSAESGARIYKTGDLGRWTANGAIEYLGRNDFQVKIRGFRIEPGEIEARLAECEGVSEVKVIAREDSPGDKQLVAYYVGGANVKPEALRAHLRANLPEYMAPAAYVRLDRMPLTHNGKLDRNALPAPDGRAYARDEYEAPVDLVEEKLARIWAGALGLDRISRNANFFDLGGHSLLAARVLALIEADFGHSLSLASLFKAPSIAALRPLLLKEGSASISCPSIVSIQPEGTKVPLFTVNTPSAYCNIARHLGTTQPVIGVQLFSPSEPLEMKFSRLEDVASACVKLIREAQPQGPYAVIGWCAAGVLAFETAQQLVQMGHEVSFIGIIDGWAPDYLRRRGKAWLKAAEFAFRCKRAYLEIRAGPQSVKSLMMKLFAWFRRAPRANANPVSSDPGLEKLWRLDEEMWAYLWKLQRAYEPKPFHGRLNIFVSEYRPTGWLADAGLGWGRLATKGAEVVMFEGDHWALFDEPAAGLAAATIAVALKAHAARDPSKAPPSPAILRPNGQSTPTDPLVSIIIPAYNAEKEIGQAIRCAITQTYPEIEIIVVDDGSRDRTAQTARDILQSNFNGRWSVLELGVNRGASAARNAALKEAKGEWIQFLDSDDAIAADKIEAQMKSARTAGPDVSAIYSSWRHVYLDDGNFVPAGPVNTPRYENKHPLMFCMYYAGLHHGACLMRRSALERVQGFDESLRSYEDADLLVRLAKERGRFQFVASNSPFYLWRLYREQAREGGENARYKLEDTAMNWVRVIKVAAGNQQIADILPRADDMIVWREHCKSYARRLLESNPGAFELFMEQLRSVDPDFTYG